MNFAKKTPQHIDKIDFSKHKLLNGQTTWQWFYDTYPEMLASIEEQMLELARIPSHYHETVQDELPVSYRILDHFKGLIVKEQEELFNNQNASPEKLREQLKRMELLVLDLMIRLQRSIEICHLEQKNTQTFRKLYKDALAELNSLKNQK